MGGPARCRRLFANRLLIAYAKLLAQRLFILRMVAVSLAPPIYLVYAHPYPAVSRANRVLVNAVRDLADVRVRSLYSDYPDFDIDVIAEQEALAHAQVIVFQHPVYWYSVPGLLKLWLDKVLTHGWAYGRTGNALAGKQALWAVTAGGTQTAYSAAGPHQHPLADFWPPLVQTVRYCGMEWLEPFVVYGAETLSAEALAGQATAYADRIAGLAQRCLPAA